MREEDRERLVRVEVGIATLIENVNDHIKADCNTLGCVLHDDVVSLKSTQKTARRITWTGVLVGLGVVAREVWKGVINV